MEKKIEEFKQFHKIEKEIDLLFKIENDQLFAFYNDQWVQLSRKKILKNCILPPHYKLIITQVVSKN